jgi:hypothetical protein
MNTFKRGLVATSIILASSFSAAADAQEKRDFQVPARFFKAGALHGVKPKPVPIYCTTDFNWYSAKPRPNAELLKRIDTLGFGGGKAGNVEFLLMNEQDQQNYLNKMQNPWAKKSSEFLLRQYNDTPNKIEFLMNTMDKNHQWPAERFGEISAQCQKVRPKL